MKLEEMGEAGREKSMLERQRLQAITTPAPPGPKRSGTEPSAVIVATQCEIVLLKSLTMLTPLDN